jgi:hypothetical protein
MDHSNALRYLLKNGFSHPETTMDRIIEGAAAGHPLAEISDEELEIGLMMGYMSGQLEQNRPPRTTFETTDLIAALQGFWERWDELEHKPHRLGVVFDDLIALARSQQARPAEMDVMLLFAIDLRSSGPIFTPGKTA